MNYLFIIIDVTGYNSHHEDVHWIETQEKYKENDDNKSLDKWEQLKEERRNNLANSGKCNECFETLSERGKVESNIKRDGRSFILRR